MYRQVNTPFLQEALKGKDEREEGKRVSAAHRQQELMRIDLRKEYKNQAYSKCMTQCFTNMDSPVVTQTESDCMTNCVSMRLEVAYVFQLNQLRAEQ